ncbi:hypothetical protein SAMN02910456_00904 [Ruminococcaceae bacterium YRB3002]|nr:hypothetical protein SAMN02910456_00904 [Ruminococcaceae bacterium YRB3002]
MAIGILNEYRNLILDYSIIKEFGGNSVFSDFIDVIATRNQDVYVSSAFKLQHYCLIHQADSKDDGSVYAMKELCSMLLPLHKLHSVQTADTAEFIRTVADIEDSIMIMTINSLLAKRLREKKIEFKHDIMILRTDRYELYHGSEEFFSSSPMPEVNPIALKKAYLDSDSFCNVGDKVVTGNNQMLELTKRVSSGAEGMVFLTDNRLKVAKIYHKGVITPLRWSKLTKMVSMGIKSAGICWPQDLLYYKGVPVGYTMFLGKGKTLGNIFDGPDAMVNNFPEWKREDVAATLINLIEKYIYLHMHNIVAGDIQLKNALLYSSNAVYLIDMDSVQVGNLPCPVGTEEFTDPRLWGRDFAGFVRKLEDEDYSIAMLVFSILFCGLHPYATRNGAETLREEILAKNFPYTLDNSNEEFIPLGGYNYIWQYLSEKLRTMLYNTFKLGRSYEAVQWYEAVLEYREDLVGKKYEDPEAYKVFPKMDYHPTAEALAEAAPGDRNRVAPGAKRRFSSVADATRASSVNNPFARAAQSSTSPFSSPFQNPNSAPASAPASPFAPKTSTPTSAPSGVYVPRQNGNVGSNGNGGDNGNNGNGSSNGGNGDPAKKKRFGLF